MVDRKKDTPMAREMLVASQTASESPVNGLGKDVVGLLRLHSKGAVRFLTSAFIVGSPLLSSCIGSPAQAGDSPTSPQATAEAFKEQNHETFESYIPEVGKVGISPIPEDNSDTEVKKIEPFDCKVLTPEACAKGKYIQWNRPDGQPIKGMGFKLSAKEEIKIPEMLVVSAVRFKEGANYRGNLITGLSQDGTRVFNYIGDIIPDPEKEIGNTGKSFPAGTIIATTGGIDLTVFPESEYTFIVQFPTEEDLRYNYPEQTSVTPKIINNQPLTTPGGSTEKLVILWDVPVVPRK